MSCGNSTSRTEEEKVVVGTKIKFNQPNTMQRFYGVSEKN